MIEFADGYCDAKAKEDGRRGGGPQSEELITRDHFQPAL